MLRQNKYSTTRKKVLGPRLAEEDTVAKLRNQKTIIKTEKAKENATLAETYLIEDIKKHVKPQMKQAGISEN